MSEHEQDDDDVTVIPLEEVGHFVTDEEIMAQLPPAANPSRIAFIGVMAGNSDSVTAFLTYDDAAEWCSQSPYRAVHEVYALSVGQPMHGVVQPAEYSLVDEAQWTQLREEQNAREAAEDAAIDAHAAQTNPFHRPRHWRG